MLRDSQVVDVERRLVVDVLIEAVLNHETVALWPFTLLVCPPFHVKAACRKAPAVAEIVMRGHATVKIPVVVITIAVVAQTIQLLRQREVAVGL